jgi:hypothetical protein
VVLPLFLSPVDTLTVTTPDIRPNSMTFSQRIYETRSKFPPATLLSTMVFLSPESTPGRSHGNKTLIGGHGLHHRIFTDHEEQALKDHMTDNHLLPGTLFTNDSFRELAIQAFLEKHPGEDMPLFACSNGFIADFKLRNGFSSRLAHLKRRPAISDSDRSEWVQTMIILLSEVGDHSRITNVDETPWRVYPTGLRTWTQRGGENIALRIGGREQDCFTVVAAITAARTKLPLTLIAAGKTIVVEHSHFGEHTYT